MSKNVLPWVLLAAAVVVALTVMKAAPPAAGPAPSVAPPPVAPSASARRFDDPPLDEKELRDTRVHIGHEECEEGAKKINVLEGREPTDIHGLHFVSVCIQHGNVAWYKCVTSATTRQQAATCNRRLLMIDNPQ